MSNVLTDVAGYRLNVGNRVQYVGDRSARTFRVSLLDREQSLVYLDGDIAAISATLLRVDADVEDLDSDPGPMPDLSNVLRLHPRPHRTANRVRPWRRTGGVA